MLSYVKTLRGYVLSGLDGEIGFVKNFLLDDRHWTIRYVEAETGAWRCDQKVLISPYAVSFVSHDNKLLSIDLTKQQVEDGPELARDDPVSRQFEIAYHAHFGWPIYWGGPHAWGALPSLQVSGGKNEHASSDPDPKQDSNLRSTHELTGMEIHGNDGSIGRIKDFLLDERTWTIRYLLTETGPWWPGRRILLSPHWIEQNTESNQIYLNLSFASVRAAPEYQEAPLVSKEYEILLHRHYKRPLYWVESDGA